MQEVLQAESSVSSSLSLSPLLVIYLLACQICQVFPFAKKNFVVLISAFDECHNVWSVVLFLLCCPVKMTFVDSCCNASLQVAWLVLVDKLTATYLSFTHSVYLASFWRLCGWEGDLVSQALEQCDCVHLEDEQLKQIGTPQGHLPCARSPFLPGIGLSYHVERAGACLLLDFSGVTHSRVKRDFVWLLRPCIWLLA